MKTYEQMLDELQKNLPKQTSSGERFELPAFDSFNEGGQTLVKNINEVAGKLRREPKHLFKFLLKELAVPGTYDGKRAVLNSKFRPEVINQKLTMYIKEYVLCTQCGKYDTNLTTFEGVKCKRCEVCGARSPVKQGL